MTKKVLITGSAGFVGSHLVQHILANTDWNIVGIDSFRHRGDSLRILQDKSRYEIYTHDLTAPISDRMIKKIGQVDYIINVASESHVDRSITNPVEFCENNFKLILTMLEYARKIQPEIFIQISTDEVYGAALENYNHKEWETHLPSNPYSGSKSAQEAMCISYWRTYGVPVVITNTMNMIGEGQDAEKFLPMLIQKIYRGEQVTIHGNDSCIGSRYYLHARNHADALLFLIRNTTPTRYSDNISTIIKPDRYNIVGEKEINNLELAQIVAKILNKELKYKLEDFHHTRPGHDRRYALDGSKLKKMGWKAPISFEDTLKKTIEWTLERPEWLE
jgi:dTDP-glucose 4,6-dehydratase